LVIASTAAVVIQTISLQHLLGVSLPGMKFGELWLTLGKILIGTLAMAAVVKGGWHWVHEIHGAEVIAVFALIPLGVAVYAAALWA